MVPFVGEFMVMSGFVRSMLMLFRVFWAELPALSLHTPVDD